MITFSSPAIWFERIGLALFFIQLWLFIFCLSPFQSGTWLNTEPAMLVLFVSATLISAWFTIGIIKKWLAIEYPVHPLIYGLLAWAAIQFINLPFVDNYMRAWLGIPQTGEGGAWHFMLALLTFFAMPFVRSTNYKKILLFIGALGLCVMIGLHFNPRIFFPLEDNYVVSNPLTPANWPDYLPVIAGWLWVYYACTPSLRNPALHFAMMLIFIAALLVGDNVAAQTILRPLFLAANIIILLILICKKTKYKNSLFSKKILKIFQAGKRWDKLAIGGFLLPLLWIVIAQQPSLYLSPRHTSAENAIAARAIFNQAAISEISHEPSILVTGNGWGSFNDDMFKYGMVEGLHSFKEGEFLPNSEWLNANIFHPHDQPLAALLSLGAVGFILFISLPILAFLPLRKSLFWWCIPVLLGINAMGLLWFTLPQVMPFEALAFAGLCAGRPARNREVKNLPKWQSVISILCAILFLISSWQQLNAISFGERLTKITEEDPKQDGIIDFLAEDIERGGDRLIEGVEYHTKQIAGKVDSGTITANDRDWYNNFMQAAHQAAISPKAAVKLNKLEVYLYILPFRLNRASVLDSLKPQIKENLADSIIRISKKAPMREDYIAPFMMSLDGFTDGDRIKQREILQAILKVAPNHRSALWLLGTLENNNEMKKRAVMLGVEKVYPVASFELESYK